ASSGYKGARRKMIEVQREQSKRIYVPAISFAIDYAALGEKDQAFYWLDKAYDERGHLLEQIKIIPEFDGLRSDPRYAALLRRMGLPP
ncbi:MAG: TPR end-of-group domain-containing protein, partial [Terriglobales bacterium]